MRERVLLVDDDLLLLQMYEQRLVHGEFEVMTATSGEACLRLLDEWQPETIVLDLAMPGLDGFDVLRRLKGHTSWREIPVLVFSARGAPEDIDTALELGATDYLVKTQSTPSDLVKKIETILGRQTPPEDGRHLRIEAQRLGAAVPEALQLENGFLCPKCGAPMLLDIVMAGAGAKDFTGSLVCPNGCS